MSAACKTILKTLHARGAKPPPWARRMAASPHPHVLRAEELADSAATASGSSRNRSASRIPFLRLAFNGRPRHLPILGPLLGGRQFIALASIAIRPLASGQRRTVTGQLTHPTSRIITGCPCGGTPRSRIHRQLRSPAAFLGLRACSLKAIYSAHPKWPRGPQCRSGWPEGVRGVSLEELDVLGVDRPSLLGRYPGASEWTFHAARTTGRRSLALGRTPPPCLGGRGCVSRLGQSQPRQTASLCCIRDQPRQFRTLLRDFRRPCPCCTHRLHPPIEPPLGPTHQFRRSKKLLPRHHFHDPPPDGSIQRLE